MSLALSHAVRAQTTAPNGRVAVEPVAKRIRVRFGGEVVADTEHALLLLERDHLPVYYLPLADIKGEFLEAVDTTSVCPWKGTARYRDIVVGDRRAANAVWSYPEEHAEALDLSAYAAFYWDRVDEVRGGRAGIGASARPVRPRRRAAVVAPRDGDSRRHRAGRLARHADRVRDGKPPRYYFPRSEDAVDSLTASETVSASPYLGVARHLALRAAVGVGEDVAWFYPEPTVEAGGIADLVSFDPQRVTSPWTTTEVSAGVGADSSAAAVRPSTWLEPISSARRPSGTPDRPPTDRFADDADQ